MVRKIATKARILWGSGCSQTSEKECPKWQTGGRGGFEPSAPDAPESACADSVVGGLQTGAPASNPLILRVFDLVPLGMRELAEGGPVNKTSLLQYQWLTNHTNSVDVA